MRPTQNNLVLEKMWYLDNVEVQSSGTVYTTSGLDEGSYVVKVEIKRGNETVTRTWNVDDTCNNFPKF